MSLVVDGSVLPVLSETSTDFKVPSRSDRHVRAVKQPMDVATQEESIGDVVNSVFREGAYVSRLTGDGVVRLFEPKEERSAQNGAQSWGPGSPPTIIREFEDRNRPRSSMPSTGSQKTSTLQSTVCSGSTSLRQPERTCRSNKTGEGSDTRRATRMHGETDSLRRLSGPARQRECLTRTARLSADRGGLHRGPHRPADQGPSVQ